VQSVFEDDMGNINVVSGIGITSFKLNDDNEMSSVSFVRSKNANFLTHQSYSSTPDGTILVGGNIGLLQIKHKMGGKDEPPPVVVVSKVRTSSSLDSPTDKSILKDILQNGLAALPKGDRNFYIYLANSRVAYYDVTEYQYWMEGLNEEWGKLKRGENRIAFENLDAGNYKLHLKCRNNYHWGPETIIKVKVSLPILETRWFRMWLILTVFAAIIIALVLRNKALQMSINKQELEIEKAHLLLEKETLQDEVATKDVQLLASSAQYAQKNELFAEIRKMLHTLRTDNSNNTAPTLRRLINVIEGEIKDEDEWGAFKYYFDKINLDFSEKLLKIQPSLTTNDIRMAMLIRLNIGTKEIAKLLNITPMGVQKSRYRLKKRLGLEEKEDLKEYLLSIDSVE
ncbi:MAG: hypothetical protein IT258_01900, partial [Saprospiraceae bacterium]|nr:hypothetical protein [Saprospiraceae bacterium]